MSEFFVTLETKEKRYNLISQILFKYIFFQNPTDEKFPYMKVLIFPFLLSIFKLLDFLLMYFSC